MENIMKRLLMLFIIIIVFCCISEKEVYTQDINSIDFEFYTGDMPDWYGKVVGVADGDTFYVDFYSEEKMGVRVMGIDTPETVDKRKPVQFWGPEASKFSKQYLSIGTIVKLDFMDEITGPFGRLIAEPWVYKEGQWVNYAKILLITGNAFVYAKYPIPVEKLHEYLEYQKIAIENGLGMWSEPEKIENDVTLSREEVKEKYYWYRKLF